MPSFSPGQEAARRLLEGPQRYTCLAGGTRSGKTFLIVRAIVARALEAPGSRHAILRFHANAARARSRSIPCRTSCVSAFRA